MTCCGRFAFGKVNEAVPLPQQALSAPQKITPSIPILLPVRWGNILYGLFYVYHFLYQKYNIRGMDSAHLGVIIEASQTALSKAATTFAHVLEQRPRLKTEWVVDGYSQFFFLQKDGNPKALQYLMGHANVDLTLNRYAHASQSYAEEEFWRVPQQKKA